MDYGPNFYLVWLWLEAIYIEIPGCLGQDYLLSLETLVYDNLAP